MAKKKKPIRHPRPIISGYLERVNAHIFDKYKKEITALTTGHQGIYALYRKDKLYYVGLASNLRNRINHHLSNRHKGKWSHFSLYIIRKTDHIKELESLLLRIADPTGNAQRGKLRTTNNLLPMLKTHVKRKLQEELDTLFKRQRSPAKTVKRAARPRRAGRDNKPLAGLFPTGKRLHADYKGVHYKAWVFKSGTVKFNRVLYDSPSSAAVAAKGGKATNGWNFWKMKTDDGTLVRLSTLRK